MKYTFSRMIRETDYVQLYMALETYDVGGYFKTSNAGKRIFAFGAQNVSDVPEVVTGDIVFGGQSFDDQSITGTALMNGFWFSPIIYVEMIGKMITFFSDDISNFDDWLSQFAPLSQKRVSIESIADEKDWIDRTDSLIELLHHDILKKVVFGRQQKIQLSSRVNVAQLILALENQTDVYHVILKNHNELFVSATPERLVQFDKGQLSTAAVAGTTSRGTSLDEDEKLGLSLLNSRKNRQEHAYVVKSIVSQLTNMTTDLMMPANPQLLKNQQVQHLYTPISGQIKHHQKVTKIMQLLHPTPALGGLPRSQALDYIRQNEQEPRGLFAAPIGYFTAENQGEFVVGIRSMWINQVKHHAILFAGAGIVPESIAEQEYDETQLKFSSMHQLLKDYNNVR